MAAEISAALARRIGLRAQGFGASALPSHGRAPAGTRRLDGAIRRLGLLQLDSVNVFARSHYLPLFSRLGAYDPVALDALIFARGSRYIECWAHEAAVVPVEWWPLFRWRMERAHARQVEKPDNWASSNGAMLDWLRAEVGEKGPVAAREVEHDANRRNGPWWGWSDVKVGLEVLFARGDLVSAGRTRFERVYATPEQILPPAVIERTVTREDAQRDLVLHAATALGIGTLPDLADYFRLRIDETRTAVLRLEEEGLLERVTVAGWGRPAWVHREARMPRRVSSAALLSPFDPVVWDRRRAERMFGFHYRIEIYTPAPKRVFGYYSLPILLDEAVVGRIDLKSDRQNGVLRVQSAWTEPDAPVDTAERVAGLVRSAAAWQGLTGVEVRRWGDLTPALASELGVRPLD